MAFYFRVYVYAFLIIIHGKPSGFLLNHFHVNMYNASQTLSLDFSYNFKWQKNIVDISYIVILHCSLLLAMLAEKSIFCFLLAEKKSTAFANTMSSHRKCAQHRTQPHLNSYSWAIAAGSMAINSASHPLPWARKSAHGFIITQHTVVLILDKWYTPIKSSGNQATSSPMSIASVFNHKSMTYF